MTAVVALRPELTTPPRGEIFSRTINAGAVPLTYLGYLPARLDASLPLLASVHGIGRNAREQVEHLCPLADFHGLAVIAPLFAPPAFKHYQRLKGGEPADRAFDRMLDDFGRRASLRSRSLSLFGFSGGAQFVHRYAMLHPARVRAMLLVAAGWYSFPDPDQPYPRGTGPSRRYPDFEPKLAEFLGIPACVAVGALDTEQDAGLRMSAALVRQQGDNRVERGRRWVSAVNRAARLHGLQPAARFELIDGADHGLGSCMGAPAMSALLEGALL